MPEECGSEACSLWLLVWSCHALQFCLCCFATLLSRSTSPARMEVLGVLSSDFFSPQAVLQFEVLD